MRGFCFALGTLECEGTRRAQLRHMKNHPYHELMCLSGLLNNPREG